MVFMGSHLLRSNSTTQGVIGSGSGEAEKNAAVRGASAGFGLKALHAELGVDLPRSIVLNVDSSACMGMTSRKGARKVRHNMQRPRLCAEQSHVSKQANVPKNWARRISCGSRNRTARRQSDQFSSRLDVVRLQDRSELALGTQMNSSA